MRISLKTIFFVVLFLATSWNTAAFAQFSEEDVSADDTYDPFADFSEFEASADEEADIHFFKNGRFFNIAFLLGARTWTQTLGELYSTAPAYGLYMTYFFDIRMALQVSFVHSESAFTVPGNTGPDGAYAGFSGNVALTAISADMKYYFNTSNITRGFAELNPYLIGGFSMNQRTISVAEEDVLAKTSPTGVQAGFGLEIPMARNKMYMGIQMMYHYVNFPDENELIEDRGTRTVVYPKGDFAEALFVLGVNF